MRTFYPTAEYDPIFRKRAAGVVVLKGFFFFFVDMEKGELTDGGGSMDKKDRILPRTVSMTYEDRKAMARVSAFRELYEESRGVFDFIDMPESLCSQCVIEHHQRDGQATFFIDLDKFPQDHPYSNHSVEDYINMFYETKQNENSFVSENSVILPLTLNEINELLEVTSQKRVQMIQTKINRISSTKSLPEKGDSFRPYAVSPVPMSEISLKSSKRVYPSVTTYPCFWYDYCIAFQKALQCYMNNDGSASLHKKMTWERGVMGYAAKLPPPPTSPPGLFKASTSGYPRSAPPSYKGQKKNP